MEKILFQKLRSFVNSIFARGVIQRVDDSKKMQSVQASFMAGEAFDDLERFQDYGFSSVPLPGAEAAAIFFGGRRDHGIILKVDDRRYRVKGLKGGEVAIFTDEGDTIIFKRGNKIEVTTNEYIVKASTKIKFESPLFEIVANETTTTGKVIAQKDIESDMTVKAKAGVFAAGYNPYASGPVAINGDLESTGDIKDSKGTIDEFRTVYNSHTHIETGVPGNQTQPPGQEI